MPPGSPSTGPRPSSSSPNATSSPPRRVHRRSPSSCSSSPHPVPRETWLGRSGRCRCRPITGGRRAWSGEPRCPRTIPGSPRVARRSEASPCGRSSRHGPPDAFVMALEAGDLCEPDLVFEVAAAVWEQPTVDIVHVDDDLLAARRLRQHPAVPPVVVTGHPAVGQLPRPLVRGAPPSPRRARAGRRRDRRRRPLVGPAARPGPRRRAGPPDPPGAPPPGPATRRPRRRRVCSSRRTSTVGATPPSEVSVQAAAGDTVRVRWIPDAWPSVDIVIPTRHNRPLMTAALRVVVVHRLPRVWACGSSTTAVAPPDNEAVVPRPRPSRSASTSTWSGGTSRSTTPRVNNVAAAASDGDVLVFLNDDTVAVDPSWLREVVGLGVAARHRAGRAPAHRRRRDASSTAASSSGWTGSPTTCSRGWRPGEDSLLGSTRWYRNVLSVTARVRRACDATLFEEIGGFDERFVLCGSDVVLGLDTTFLGLRNVVLAVRRGAAPRVRHAWLRRVPPTTSSRATGATRSGWSAATRTTRRTSPC